MGEALAEVKREFGSDAVILHTRTFAAGGVLGYGGTERVEITASKDDFSLPTRRARARVASASRTGQAVDGATRMTPAGHEHSLSAKTLALSDQIDGLESAVREFVADTQGSPEPELGRSLRDAYHRLIESEVAEKIAARLVKSVRAELPDHQSANPAKIRKRLAAHIEATLPVAEPARITRKDGPTVIALVGPTGVGKTTTVAKLAAQYRLRQGRNVGLVTIDTYRIAAVEQLRTYARIIDVPLEVAATREQLRAALGALKDCDVILIDTAGRSQNDHGRLQELDELLREACPDEVHLVLSVAAGSGVLKQAVERFSALGVNRLIFTKLDEAVGFGVTLDCLRQAEVRLSYVTTGQEVPDDIEEGRCARLASLIVDGRDAHPQWRTPGRQEEPHEGRASLSTCPAV